MVDGPYMGWKPTLEDWDRLRIESVIYVDKDGIMSSTGTNLKLQGNDGYDQGASSHNPESSRRVHPLGGSTESADSGVLRQTTWTNGPAGYGAIQPGDLPPADFFVNNPWLPDGSGMSSPSEFSTPSEASEGVGINGNTGGINGTRIAEDPSSVLPMGLMIYNDLMMDIEGTARFLGQEFKDSVLFGPTSTLASQYPDQDPEVQSPNTMPGWVLP